MKACDICRHPAKSPGARRCSACQSYWQRHGKERPYASDGRSLRLLGHNPSGVQPRWDEALGLKAAGLSTPQVAARMGVTVTTAQSYVRWGRQALREVG